MPVGVCLERLKAPVAGLAEEVSSMSAKPLDDIRVLVDEWLKTTT